MQETQDEGLIPGSARCPGGAHGNPFQYSCLGDPMDRGAWQATVPGVSKSQTRLKWQSMHAAHAHRSIFLEKQIWAKYFNEIPTTEVNYHQYLIKSTRWLLQFSELFSQFQNLLFENIQSPHFLSLSSLFSNAYFSTQNTAQYVIGI